MVTWQDRASELLEIKGEICVGFPPSKPVQMYTRYFANVIPNLFEVVQDALVSDISKDAEIERLKAELEVRTRELRLTREGKVFLSGDVYCSAMIAAKVLDWDALTAMTFTPENEQLEYANSAEEFRRQAEAHLAGRGE